MRAEAGQHSTTPEKPVDLNWFHEWAAKRNCGAAVLDLPASFPTLLLGIDAALLLAVVICLRDPL